MLGILYLMAMHLWRAATPWYHGDEINVYGLFGSVISQGFVYSDIIPIWHRSQHLGPKMVESLDAQLILLGHGGTHLAKLARLANLALLSVYVYQFTRWLTKKPAFGLFAAGLLLQIPELRFLGAALKVDSVVMCFELIAIMKLAMVFIGTLPEYALEPALRKKQAILAFALALASFGSRQSGMYLVSLTGAVCLYFLWREPLRPATKIAAVAALVVGGLIFSVTPIFHIVYFGNPLYPFPGPWPFRNGTYIRTVDYFRGISNLQGLPPVITQFYLIFHLGLGLEWRQQYPDVIRLLAKALPWHFTFPELPHALHRGTSMEWLHPALILIYAAPFFWKKSKPILYLSLIFLYLYIIWSSGIQFSRVFLAGSSIPIFIGILIWNLAPADLSKTQRILRWCTMAFLGISFISLMRNSYNYNEAYPRHGYSTFWSSKARAEALEALFEVGGNKSGLGYPSPAVRAKMDAVLEEFGHPKVYAFDSWGRQIRILFQKGFFTEQQKDTDHVNCALIQETPGYFYGDDKPAVERLFPDVRVAGTPEDPWTLRCKAKGTPGGPS